MPEQPRTFGQKVKENPIKTATSILVLLTMIVTTAFAIDARYLHAGGLKGVQQQQVVNMVTVQNQMTQHSIDEIRLEIFKINFKINNDTAEPLDHALLGQYEQQLRQKESEIKEVPTNE